MDTPGNLVDAPTLGVVFWIRISPQIRSQNRNGSKYSVRNLGQSDLCKNLGKFGSLPCPLKSSSICELIAGEHEWWTLPSCQTARPLSMRSPVMSLLPPRDFRWGSCVVGRMSVVDTAVMPDSSPFVHEVTSDESLATQGLQVRFLCVG